MHSARNRAEHAFADEVRAAARRAATSPRRDLSTANPTTRIGSARTTRSGDGSRVETLRAASALPADSRRVSVRPGRLHGPADRGSAGPRHRSGPDHSPSRSAPTMRSLPASSGKQRSAASPRRPGRDGPAVSFARSNLTANWGRATPACSSSPKRVTCRCNGRAAPACATPARPRCCPDRSRTRPTPSTRPATATHSSAAPNLETISSSTFEPGWLRWARFGDSRGQEKSWR